MTQRKNNTSTKRADILKFAESQINAPLMDWQKEMLLGLLKGEFYIAGRNIGKQQVIDIYRRWLEKEITSECCECEYTYDEIMAGIPANPSIKS